MLYSIIIPVYDDPVLKACLASVAQLNTTLDFEVIVVENSSTKWIRPLVESMGFQYMHESITGSYRARNTGITQAKGDVLVFTDSDCVVDPNWLNVIHHQLSNTAVDGVMGFSAGAISNAVAAFEQQMYEANIGKFTNAERLKRADTRNLAVKRSVIERIGQFKAELKYGGDMEFGARAHAAGCNLVYDAAMLVTHHNATRLKPLLFKRVRQNYGNMVLTDLYDTAYLELYFPQLLRYTATTGYKLQLKLLQWLLVLNAWCCDALIAVLPKRLGYTYFKVLNVAAMRIGQLQFIFKQPSW